MPRIVVPFGGGLHTRAFAQDINEQNCAEGQNFKLDPQDRAFKVREPLELVATATNAGQINGFASLLQSDGTVKALVQAGDTVYDWDGSTTFTSKGTVSSSARLRGRIEQNWQLSDKVIITDIALVEPVMEYDGTTLQDVSFLSNPSTAWTGDFRARYCLVSNERAIYANIYDNGTSSPHLIVGSKRGDYTTLSVSDRPSTALSAEDPFFLVQPNNRYINGVAEAFGVIAFSSSQGSIWKMIGDTPDSDAVNGTPFSMESMHPGSGAEGDEAFTFVGNDIVYGRPGRLESLVSTDRFGDIDADDISNDIFDQIEDYTAWTIIYNSRNQRVYCFPSGQSECWVYHKSMIPTQLSAWSKWVTDDDFAFQPTAVMNMYDPQDGLEYVFAGDASGNIYRLEGAGTGDNGAAILSYRKSKLFKVEGIAEVSEVSGYIEYVSNQAVTATIRLYYQGEAILTQEVTTTIPAATVGAVYGGAYYYNDGTVYGTQVGSLKRQKIHVPGGGNMFQVEVEVNSTNNFEITEIGLEFEAAQA